MNIIKNECSKREKIEKLRKSGFFTKCGILLNERLNKLNKRKEIAKKSAFTRKLMGINVAIKSAKTRKMNDTESFIKSGIKAHLTRIERNIYNKNKINGTYDKMILKRHETLKKNNSYGKSKKEELFFSFLKNNFCDIKRQVCTLKEYKDIFRFMKGYHTFDFVINYYDDIFFICFDGVYYHGLDRSIIDIAKHKTETDKIIFDTYYRDRNLENFCQKNNLNLLRFSDKNFDEFYLNRGHLNPYFVCGNSEKIDNFIKIMNIGEK